MNNYISTAPLYYGTYLAHHGIKGQKWGERNYQNPDGTLTTEGRLRYRKSADYYRDRSQRHINKIDSSKTRIGKNWHNSRAYANDFAASRRDLSKKERRSFSENFGYGLTSRKSKAMGDYYQRKSEYSKTKFGKNYNARAAYNNRSYAETTAAVKSAKGKEKISKAFKAEFKTPIKNCYTGKETTTGKVMLVGALAGATYVAMRTILNNT